MKSAASVGGLVVVFIALVFASFAILGKSLFTKPYDNYYIEMTDAAGLSAGAPVHMAGVQIGLVDKVGLQGARRVRFTISVRKEVKIPEGSVALIQGSLIGFGEPPLSITPPDTFTGNLSPGAVIPGRMLGPLDAMFPNGGKDLYKNVTGTLSAIQKLLQDRRLQTDLKTLLETSNVTLKSSQKTLAQFAALAAHTDGLLTANRANLDGIVSATRSTIEQVHGTAAALAEFVRKGKLQNGATAMLDKANRIEGQASDLLNHLNAIVANPKLQKDLSDTVANVKATSDQGPAIAANTQKITANVAEITERSKTLPDNLNTIAIKASKLEDRLSDLLDKVNGIKPPSTQGFNNITTEIDEIRETDPAHWRTDINANWPIKDGFVTFGVYDAFESNRFNLQLARYITPKLDVRYGAYASKPGAGVDYAFTPKFGIRADLWDINSPELDAKLKYDFGGGLVGWAGFERILSHTEPVLGIGIRK